VRCPKCKYKRKESDANPEWQCPSCGIAYAKFQATEKKSGYQFTSNHIKWTTRLYYSIASVSLFSYGAYGIYINDLFLPARGGGGTHFQDGPAYVLFGAIICGCLYMISVVIDHYDKRDNEDNYHDFGMIMKYLGIALLFAAIALKFKDLWNLF
jgi:hypothetical protein